MGQRCPSCGEEDLEWVKTELPDPEAEGEVISYQYCSNCDYGCGQALEYDCVWGASPPFTNACDKPGQQWRDEFPYCNEHAEVYDVLVRNEAKLAELEEEHGEVLPPKVFGSNLPPAKDLGGSDG